MYVMYERKLETSLFYGFTKVRTGSRYVTQAVSNPCWWWWFQNMEKEIQ